MPAGRSLTRNRPGRRSLRRPRPARAAGQTAGAARGWRPARSAARACGQGRGARDRVFAAGRTGPAPEPLVGQLAKIVAGSADAPRDAGREAEVWDEDRIRATDRSMALSGDRRHTVVARHDASGELVAMTAVHVAPEQPEFGFQGLTAVAREHRGHRLGLAVKVAMLDLIAQREPQVERIMTFNAADNTYMIAINDAIGFQVTGEFRSWQVAFG